MDPIDFTPSEIALLRQTCKEWTAEKWCANWFVMDALDGQCQQNVQAPEATRWCVQGYLAKLSGCETGQQLQETPLFLKVNTFALRSPEKWHIAGINNIKGHAATIALLRQIIEAYEQAVEA